MTVVCVGCGEAMGLRPRGKSVCSVRCWWRAYRARRRREMRQRCASCEDVFTPTRRDAQYCSPLAGNTRFGSARRGGGGHANGRRRSGSGRRRRS